MNKYNKISIYYRQTSHNKISPTRVPWFDYEKCFKTLLDSINFNLINLTICFDGSQLEYNNHFTKKYQEEYKFRVILIDTKSYTGTSYEKDGSSKSSCLVSQIIKNDNLQNDSLIMMQENDYIFRPIDWGTIVLDLYNNYIDENTYLSLYDNLDKYIFNKSEKIINEYKIEKHWGMYRGLQNSIILGSYNHWRETPLINSSWIMSKKIFDRDIEYHSIGMSDNTLSGKISEKYGTKFLTPILSISTHSESFFLAPFIPWRQILENAQLL